MSSILGPDQAEGLRKMFPKTNTKIIAVTSGKGGVGKSNFSLNLGIALANMKDSPKRVIVLDADLGLANINVLLGVIPRYNLYHVIKGQKKINEIIHKTDVGVDIIGSASGIAQLANIKDEEKQNLLDALKEISYADYIIVDTSAGISANVISFVLAAHETIVITTPEPTSITDAYGIIKTIVTEGENTTIKLVMNRVKSPAEAKKVSQKIIDICAQFLNIKIENVGYIYDDPVVPESVRKQIPVMQMAPNSQVALCIDHIARRIMNLEVSEDESGWKKFLGIFSRKEKKVS